MKEMPFSIAVTETPQMVGIVNIDALRASREVFAR